MRFGHVARDSYQTCCDARKAATSCRKGFDSGLRRQTKHFRPSLALSKPSVTAAAFFGSESPLNPTEVHSSSNSLGLPEPGSSLAHCSTCDYQRRRLRARGVLRDRWLLAFWMWLRRGATPLVVLLGIASLICFAVALTRVDSAFAGRAYAAYGGMYIAASLVWLWAAEGQRPTVTDLIGAALAMIGALVIIGFA